MATSGGRQTPKRGRETEGRLRSNTDSAIHAVVSSFDNIDLESSAHKAKLYELFALIEKEFDALHAENTALRLQSNTDRSGFDTPITNTNAESYAHSDLSFKTTSKKTGAQMRQKWKTAFGRPPGKLVNSLKVGAGVDRSKYSFARYYEGHQDGVWHVAATSNFVTALVGSASADQTAKIWSADSGQCLLNYTGHSGSVNSITFHPDSTNYNTDQLTVLTASGDKTAHIWKTVPQAHVTAGIIGSSEDDVDTTSVKGEVENEAEAPTSTVPVVLRQPLVRLTGHTGVVISSEWLVGGDQILTASWDRTANIYDAENGKILNTLTGHDQELTHCNAHSTQKLVATASKDYTFRLWDFRETIQSVAVFQGHNDAVTSVVFSSTHHIISGSDDRTVKVWDLRNMRSPISAMRLSSPVNRLAVSHKYNLIAIPLDSRHICIYDFQGIRITRLPRANGRCHRRMVCSAAWLSDNTMNNLFTSSFDKQIIGWKVSLGKN
uniref:WD repeat-containing protein 37 n=1 Tax=Acrobeloides nanus TaxID=290746 RepID=A0A914CYR5_9BILA